MKKTRQLSNGQDGEAESHKSYRLGHIQLRNVRSVSAKKYKVVSLYLHTGNEKSIYAN